MSDYNVTCPDYRFCEVRHTYRNPCEIWDCDACWWHYANCTATPEGPSDECPYIKKCYDLPRPHSHTVTTVLTVLGVLASFGMVGAYVFRRYRRAQENIADTEQQEEEEEERVPLLQRCRHFLSASLPGHEDDSHSDGRSVFRRFRDVIFGRRESVAPRELPGLDDREEDFEPSAPPPSYDSLDQENNHQDEESNENQDPIIRGSGPAGRSLRNENYEDGDDRSSNRSVEMREISSTAGNQERTVSRMEEVLLSKSFH